MKVSTKLVFACLLFALVSTFGLLGQTVYAEGGMAGCEKKCSSCEQTCEKATAYLKGKAASTASTAAQKSLADCADLCKVSHNLMQRESALHPATCKICAEACTSCAKACEALKDPKLKECIQECKTCADSCSKMAG